jgi:PAS domain S-box-containing protein
MKTTTPKKSEISHSETEKLLTISDNNLKQLHNIFLNAPAAIAAFEGPEQKFTFANKAYEKIINRKAKDLIGQSLRNVLPELKGTGTFEIYDNILKTGESYIDPEYATLVDKKNDGVLKQCYFNFSMEPLKNDAGEVYAVLSMTFDITEQVLSRKKIEAIEERFRNLVEQSPVPMLVLKGENMIFEIANGPMLKLWHVGKEAIGKSMLEIMPEIKNQSFWEYLSNVFHKGITQYGKEEPAYFIRKNGQKETLYFNFVYQPYYEDNGNISGVIVTANDVTEQVLSRKKIEESEHKYQNLIFTSPYMIAIFKGKDTIIEIANDAIIETWGKGKDVIGKSLFEVLPEVASQGFDKLIQNVYETGEPYYAYETPVTLIRNGKQELMHYNFVFQAQRNVAGEIEGLAVLANEVTLQAEQNLKIKESEELLRKTTEHFEIATTAAEVGTWSLDLASKTLEWSDLHKKMWGYDEHRTDLVYEDWHKVILDSDKEVAFAALAKALETKTPYETSYRIKLDGKEEVRWMRASGKYLYNDAGKAVTLSGISMDITEQKRIEKELIDAKIKAENAVQAKQQFLSNMSHEIRTPMNAIIGFTNVILKTELTDSQKQYLDAIKVSGDALVVLINDILDLAKVDSGKMTFEKIAFDLAECIHKTVLLFKIKLEEKKLKFNLNLDESIPNQIIGDGMRLRQIILNLLSNAIKFTDKGSISLDVKVLSQTKNKINIEFKITDTGIGIANEKLETIFNNFEQAHAETSANYGGTGLGLAIVKKLVENQGGTIVTKSEIGKGSTFSFTLNFDTNDLQHHLPKKTIKNNMICQYDMELKNIKILVAEDVALNQLLIKVVLGSFNFEVDIAENGKIAIEKIKTNPYDLVLMDLHMPEMNGIEATKHIREEMKLQIPIIALTADVTQADIDKCLAVGMQDYISKPIDEAILYEKIVKVLNENQK